MTTDLLELEILAPDGVVAQRRVSSLEAADATGRFGIWPNHEPLVTVLAPCVLLFRSAAGQEEYAAVDGGVLLVEMAKASIVSREALVSKRLDDVAEKAAALLAARRTQDRSATSAFAQLEAALARQVGRLENKK